MLDHRIPSLAFRISEKSHFAVDMERLAAEGLVRGGWLRELERRFVREWQIEEPMTVPRQRGSDWVEEKIESPSDLYRRIRKEHETAAIGYLTDWGFTPANLARVEALFSGLSLLICECSFLAADKEKARESWHLCTADLNSIAERLRPRALLPMHLSKGYIHKSGLLYEELVPPPGVSILKVPELITPRPLIPAEVPPPSFG
jgi:ribonuclease Z